ncbi:hypothetical protein BD626DRAFT_499676 [Schizophyllum amplum]|uniref:Uncharacterized protein n=1 Tax=Schizophyllum amplum TaxID=97359 RepID=A0A550CB83_9AGAR|nr:hypothetical protein BD626DRAFT_499676 [Auriculariopsis ampla]
MLSHAKPPWYNAEDLTFYTAENHPRYTLAVIVDFLRRNAVSVKCDKKRPRSQHDLVLRLGSSEAVVSAEIYRIPVVFLSNFLWGSVWSVIMRQELWEDHMFNILHIARLLQSLHASASNAAKHGQSGPLWRCTPFDRALLRMSYDEFILPVDSGYGEAYNERFWNRYKDKKYNQDVSDRPWMDIAAGKKGERIVPALNVKDELHSFNAAAYVECLHMRPDGPVWEPVSEAGRQATSRLRERYKEVMADIELPPADNEATPAGSADAVRADELTIPAEEDVIMSSRPCTPEKDAPPAVSAELEAMFANGMTFTRENQDVKPTIGRSSQPPSSPPGDFTSGQPGTSARSTNRLRSVGRSPLRSASPNASRVASTSSQRLQQRSRTPSGRSPVSLPPRQEDAPRPTSVHQSPPCPVPASRRAASPSRSQPVDQPVGRPQSKLEAEIAQLRAIVAGHEQYRALSEAFAENAKQEREAAREREARHAEDIAQLRREAALREARHTEERREAAQREARQSEMMAQVRQEVLAVRQEALAEMREREARWLAERTELKAAIVKRSELLAERNMALSHEMALSADLHKQLNTLQTGLNNLTGKI